jgi:hypothetical protein
MFKIIIIIIIIIFSGSAGQRGLWSPRSRGFLITHAAPQSVRPLWTSDQSVVETSTWQHTQQITMPPVGFEATIAADERPHSRNRFCCGKAIHITYCGCVFVALGIQQITRMRSIVTCGLPRSTISLHIISQKERFSMEKSYWT